MLRVAGVFVVGSNEDLAVCDHGVAVSLRTKFGHPFHSRGGCHVGLFGPGFGFAGLKSIRKASRWRLPLSSGIIPAPPGPILCHGRGLQEADDRSKYEG